MKACRRCGSDSNGYYPQTRSKDGLRPYCKMCDKAQSRITYAKNKTILKIKSKNFKKRDFTDEELVLYDKWYLERIREFANAKVDAEIPKLDYYTFYKEVVVSLRRSKKMDDLGI